jgi:hypothetical protein
MAINCSLCRSTIEITNKAATYADIMVLLPQLEKDEWSIFIDRDPYSIHISFICPTCSKNGVKNGI